MKLLEVVSEKEIKEALLAEYEKKLVLYKLTDERLKKKYKMSFKEFLTETDKLLEEIEENVKRMERLGL